MKRLALAGALILVLALPRLAAAAGCDSCSTAPPGQDVASAGLSRRSFLIWAATVDVAFTGLDTVELVRGKRNGKITGLQLVMAFPIAVYGIQFIKDDSGDWASWAATLWSTGLLVHGLWPVIRARINESSSDDDDSTTFHISPAPIVGWADQQLHAGLTMSGTF